MARTKEFDPDLVLRRAMELFWERGYEATSLADLVDHLGIGRASLYATFGSKHDLYLAAIRRYLRGSEAGFVTALAQPGPALPAVRAFVESWVTDALTDSGRRGCLVVNAAVELAPRDPEVARQVEASWRVVETALVSALLRARAQGELAPGKDPHEIAHFLLVLKQGVRVIARAAPDAERLGDAVRLALAVLD
ncbi:MULTISPECIES: TetR/AcrR family transcriptional regulator [unclassified Streptomyces]|uniref:TetR/AcrR family transcriptional regulator n=1 Tax=unclassified Streptomyces TaxID=2593676 RepID=UPI00136AB5DB|nr:MULTISPECIES: TetR/AcrR family transcriptional regulator [unclassified Streptomyces]MCW5251981.1 TetR/AcrR family transcriptional regulator [Streptomyces sp. SHP 1-2]MYU26159.1 TetR family transcriptional regulator [Streptomyces sp. SID8352]